MTKHKVIFVHGISGSTKRDFFPALFPELKKLNIDFDIQNFPRGFLNAFPKADRWMDHLHNIVRNTTKPIIFVGFSLGTRAILLYLEKYPMKVDKVILIAALANLHTYKSSDIIPYPPQTVPYKNCFVQLVRIVDHWYTEINI
jgi:predicted alpha/beta hydrolase family esterase